jgi:hypothetical protein
MAARVVQERRRLKQACYEVTLLSIAGNSIDTLSGLSIVGACPFSGYNGFPDTLIVAGEPDSHTHPLCNLWGGGPIALRLQAITGCATFRAEAESPTSKEQEA